MIRAAILAAGLVLSLLAPLAGPWATPTFAQDATPAADCPVTTEEENQAIVQRFFDILESGDLDALDEVLPPVVYMHAAGVMDGQGIAEAQANLAFFTTAFPDLRIDVEQWFTDDEYVAARAMQSGTHLGDFFGIPPTGLPVTWAGNTIYRFQCGRIAEQWAEVDSVGRLRQLGVIPALGTPSPSTPAAEPMTDATPASDPAACPATTEEENEALIQRWYDEVWTQGNLANFDDFIAPDHVRGRPAGLGQDEAGLEARRAALQASRAVYSDLSLTPDFLLSSGDRVVARVTTRGTQEQPWRGIPATGDTVTWTAIVIYRLECGRIAEQWAEADWLAVYEQLGAIEWPPAPAEASPAAG